MAADPATEFAIARYAGEPGQETRSVVEIFRGSEEDAWSRAFHVREQANDGARYYAEPHPQPTPSYVGILSRIRSGDEPQ